MIIIVLHWRLGGTDMPLTKREAEIRNIPLRNETTAMAVWNRAQDKKDESVPFMVPGGSNQRRRTWTPGDQLGSRATPVGKRVSASAASSPEHSCEPDGINA